MVAIGRNVSRKQALELALTGDVIPAETALAWGLVNRVVPSDELDAAVLDLLGRATRGSRSSKALGKQAFYTQIGMDQPQAYAYAVEVMASASQTADAREGVRRLPREAPPDWPADPGSIGRRITRHRLERRSSADWRTCQSRSLGRLLQRGVDLGPSNGASAMTARRRMVALSSMARRMAGSPAGGADRRRARRRPPRAPARRRGRLDSAISRSTIGVDRVGPAGRLLLVPLAGRPRGHLRDRRVGVAEQRQERHRQGGARRDGEQLGGPAPDGRSTSSAGRAQVVGGQVAGPGQRAQGRRPHRRVVVDASRARAVSVVALVPGERRPPAALPPARSSTARAGPTSSGAPGCSGDGRDRHHGQQARRRTVNATAVRIADDRDEHVSADDAPEPLVPAGMAGNVLDGRERAGRSRPALCAGDP